MATVYKRAGVKRDLATPRHRHERVSATRQVVLCELHDRHFREAQRAQGGQKGLLAPHNPAHLGALDLQDPISRPAGPMQDEDVRFVGGDPFGFTLPAVEVDCHGCDQGSVIRS